MPGTMPTALPDAAGDECHHIKQTEEFRSPFPDTDEPRFTPGSLSSEPMLSTTTSPSVSVSKLLNLGL